MITFVSVLDKIPKHVESAFVDPPHVLPSSHIQPGIIEQEQLVHVGQTDDSSSMISKGKAALSSFPSSRVVIHVSIISADRHQGR